ncbi:MAG: SDR family NAD(P)-dependent oxidoreductase, partial [Desulfuromusa sp.]|nr:SDR family NAD(P)-dependent oxidoreductase [Desulfuromusa sp.]
SMSEYFMAVADMYELPQPKQLSWLEAEKEMNPLTFSFLKESRRMSNQKLLTGLGIELSYPTLAEGLFACRTVA